MTRHFLRYWISRDGNWSVLDEPLLTYSASDQYDRVSLDDVIWAVVLCPADNHLILLGRMTVDWIGSRSEASAKLQMSEEKMWDADIYVTCDNPEPYDPRDINDYAGELRFISNTNDRLDLDDGLVSPQQLQTMRELTPETVSLLRDIWYGDYEVSIEPVKDESAQQLFSEGKRRMQAHYRRERSTKLVSLAKQQFKTKQGRLFCEVCGFDFSAYYGEIGEDFIEAHHRVPLSDLDIHDTRETTVTDLAMVCANCHRMLHRRKPWLSVEELKTILKSD